MKLSTKAVIYSAVIFPGAGYFLLNHFKRGILALSVIMACFCVLMFESFYKAQLIVEKMKLSGNFTLNIEEILHQLTTIQGKLPELWVSTISWTLFIVWLISLIDVYRLGRKLQN